MSFTDHERRARDAFQQHTPGRELPTVSFEICVPVGAVLLCCVGWVRCLSIFSCFSFSPSELSTQTTWTAACCKQHNDTTRPSRVHEQPSSSLLLRAVGLWGGVAVLWCCSIFHVFHVFSFFIPLLVDCNLTIVQY